MMLLSIELLQHVIPAKAGIHEFVLTESSDLLERTYSLTPAYAGVTGWVLFQ